jgi:hypothetical protein
MDAEDASHALGSVIGVIAKAVTRFGGVVIRRMGDGVMVLFGAPVSTEDHASRACFAALAVLDDVGRMGDLALPVRVGMCSGPVILRKTGRDDEDYDVAGITAHIAARLEQQAAPGTVLLAQQTASLVTGIANLESIGRISLKGIAEPLPLFRLLSATDRPSWIVRSGAKALSTFVGREEELRQLSLTVARAWAGRMQAVALVADAGMGKSRLLHEFAGTLAQGSWHVMRVGTTPQSTLPPACRRSLPRWASTPDSIRPPCSPISTGKWTRPPSTPSNQPNVRIGWCSRCGRFCCAMPTFIR